MNTYQAPSKASLLSYFDSWTLVKGEDYFKRKQVKTCTRTSVDEVCGEVFGSSGRTYKTTLSLDNLGYALQDTDCSCPIGGDCKHAVALYLTYLKQVSQEASDPFQKKLVSDLLDPSYFKKFEPSPLLPLPNEIRRSFELFASRLDQGRQSSVSAAKGAGVHKQSRKTELVYVVGKQTWRDEPNIEFRSVTVLKDGSFGKSNPISLDRMLRDRVTYAQSEDLEIARFWHMICQQNAAYWSSSNSLANAEPEMVRMLLTKILNTGRCYYEDSNTEPLKLGAELPGELTWEESARGTFHVAATARDGEAIYPCLRNSICPWYVDSTGSRLGPIKINLDSKTLGPLFSMRELTRSEAERIPVLLSELGISEILPAPAGLKHPEIVLVKPTPRLQLKNACSSSRLVWDQRAVVERGERIRAAIVTVPLPKISSTPYLDSSGNTIVEKADLAAIQSAVAPLVALGFGEVDAVAFPEAKPGERFFVAPDPDTWIGLDSEKLAQMRHQGWDISSETEAALLPLDLDSQTLNFEVEGEDNWWFSLALNIEVNGKIVPLLPVLISAIRRLKDTESLGDSIDTLNRDGKFLGFLADGTIVSIPFERIRSILVSIQELIEKGLDPNKKMPVVDAVDLLADETLSKSRFIGADKIVRLVQGLKALKHIEKVEAPKKFATELRPYQLDGLGWLQFMAQYEFGGILADDMGLGKTIQLLAHICLEKQNGRLASPYLVICPTSVLPNWLAESAKFAPQLKVMQFQGQSRHENVRKISKADLVVTTYPVLVRDLEIFEKVVWHGIALDEAQAIKNHTTKVAQAARSLKANHKFCLTGTPVENHLGELWSQFQFLLPGLLGDASTFKNVFRDPIEKLGDSLQKQLLARRVKPFILRRTKHEVATELPDKTIIIQRIDLAGSQRDLYETVRLASTKKVRDEIAKKGFKHSQIMILDALLKMRQVCCDPRLVKLTAASKVKTSAKLDVLIETLEQLTEEGHKVLVFSQFTSMLEIIKSRLERSGLEYVTLTGETKDRAKPVNQFQNGSAPIFLISLKAGGTGLNLTAADVVIHYDPWWNPAVEEQATDRAHRIGQTKKVFVYKFIAQGTIEQRMIDLQERKRAIANSVYDEQGNVSMKFSERDLEALLSPIDDGYGSSA